MSMPTFSPFFFKSRLSFCLILIFPPLSIVPLTIYFIIHFLSGIRICPRSKVNTTACVPEGLWWVLPCLRIPFPIGPSSELYSSVASSMKPVSLDSSTKCRPMALPFPFPIMGSHFPHWTISSVNKEESISCFLDKYFSDTFQI